MNTNFEEMQKDKWLALQKVVSRIENKILEWGEDEKFLACSCFSFNVEDDLTEIIEKGADVEVYLPNLIEDTISEIKECLFRYYEKEWC